LQCRPAISLSQRAGVKLVAGQARSASGQAPGRDPPRANAAPRAKFIEAELRKGSTRPPGQLCLEASTPPTTSFSSPPGMTRVDMRKRAVTATGSGRGVDKQCRDGMARGSLPCSPSSIFPSPTTVMPFLPGEGGGGDPPTFFPGETVVPLCLEQREAIIPCWRSVRRRREDAAEAERRKRQPPHRCGVGRNDTIGVLATVALSPLLPLQMVMLYIAGVSLSILRDKTKLNRVSGWVESWWVV
jgi:hypothetical protein